MIEKIKEVIGKEVVMHEDFYDWYDKHFFPGEKNNLLEVGRVLSLWKRNGNRGKPIQEQSQECVEYVYEIVDRGRTRPYMEFFSPSHSIPLDERLRYKRSGIVFDKKENKDYEMDSAG